MTVVLELPPEFQKYADGQATVELEGQTVNAVLDELCLRFPDLDARVRRRPDEAYPYLPIFLNGKKLPLQGLSQIEVNDGDRLEVFALASGG